MQKRGGVGVVCVGGWKRKKRKGGGRELAARQTDISVERAGHTTSIISLFGNFFTQQIKR